MKYTNKELENFVGRIKLTQEKKRDYTNQIDNLKEKVTKAIGSMGGVSLERVKRAGSWKKGTALAPRGDRALDVDMVFFLKKEEGYEYDGEDIREELVEALVQTYPNKGKEDFKNGRTTVGVVFRGTGLEVDIVPFIPERKGSSYGKQAEKELGAGCLRTSVRWQLEFVRDMKRANRTYASMVRLLKYWRNEQEVELGSFGIEIILGDLIRKGEISTTGMEDGLIKFWETVGRERELVIRFGKTGEVGEGRPWISDPANDDNNAVGKNLEEWGQTRGAAEKAWETISYARTVTSESRRRELWKEIMGSRFNTEEQ